jgi:hypothetical protein
VDGVNHSSDPLPKQGLWALTSNRAPWACTTELLPAVATSGQTWGSNSDDTGQAPLFNHENLVDQLEAAHVSWKAYMEDLPFPGDRAWTNHSAIFITWDEGGFEDQSPFGPTDITPGPDSPILPATPADPTSGGGGDLAGGTVYGGGHVPMIVVAAGVGHRVDSVFADHYSLLQTIERNFGLPLLGDAGDTVQVSSLAPLLH